MNKYKKKTIIFGVVTGLSFFVAIVTTFNGMMSVTDGVSDGEAFTLLLSILIGIVFLILTLASIPKTIKENKKIKEIEKQREMQLKYTNQIPLYSGNLEHRSGLPVASGINCKLTVYNDRLEIMCSSGTFNIPKERVLAFDSVDEKQLEYVSKQSISKALAGGMLMGDVGAILGGLPKLQAREYKIPYLAIIYKDKIQDINSIVLGPCYDNIQRKVFGFYQNNATDKIEL